MRLYMGLLRLYPPDRLARVGREHHIEAVRRRAWLLSGAFVAGEGTYFNWHVSVVLERWGDLAATLGERVALAPGVTFVAASGPCYSRLAEIEGFADRHIAYAPITVGDDTWIGANVTMLPGVTIGTCCLIGAGSVVTRDVPDYAIAAGVPARIVGDVRGAAETPSEEPP
jgi:acetyltransferase-like isoleucine patch superfamily enzyme